MVTLTANDNWVEFTLRFVTDYKHPRVIRDVLFTHILEAIEKPGSRVVIASTTLQHAGDPAPPGTAPP